MQLPLRLALKPSRQLTIMLALLHLAALGSLFPLDLPAWPRLVAACAVILSAVTAIRRHAFLLSPYSVRELTLGADGSVEAASPGQNSFPAAISLQSTVFTWLVVLLLDAPGSRRRVPVVILPDSLQADEFRALRSWLRWKAT
jgi:toxin CptA